MLVNALYLTGDFKLALCSATTIIQLHGGKIFLKIIYLFFFTGQPCDRPSPSFQGNFFLFLNRPVV